MKGFTDQGLVRHRRAGEDAAGSAGAPDRCHEAGDRDARGAGADRKSWCGPAGKLARPEYTAQIRSEIEKTRKLVKERNISFDD